MAVAAPSRQTEILHVKSFCFPAACMHGLGWGGYISLEEVAVLLRGWRRICDDLLLESRPVSIGPLVPSVSPSRAHAESPLYHTQLHTTGPHA